MQQVIGRFYCLYIQIRSRSVDAVVGGEKEGLFRAVLYKISNYSENLEPWFWDLYLVAALCTFYNSRTCTSPGDVSDLDCSASLQPWPHSGSLRDPSGPVDYL